jgi:predicted membrane channel-forming protein YqfA (hemolysin III family)
MTPKSGIERRLRISGSLIIAGLMVEIISLMWSHPTAFLLFLLLGGLLLALGIIIYLYSLVAREHPARPGEQS